MRIGKVKSIRKQYATIGTTCVGLEDHHYEEYISPQVIPLTTSSDADDIHIHDDAYRSVPVQGFGAALLKGMGWTGPGKGDAKERSEGVKVRPHRLGLGAAPRYKCTERQI